MFMVRDNSRYRGLYVASVVADAQRHAKASTMEDIVGYLLEDGNDKYCLTKYVQKSKRTTFQRVNLIWVTPLALLWIPIQYIAVGTMGARHKTRMGRLLDFLVGVD